MPPERDWDAVYDRQGARAERAPEWFDALGLAAGDRLVAVGCGPGQIVSLAADRVGVGGTVYALDRSPAAIRYLRQHHDLGNVIRPVVTDATSLGVRFRTPLAVLLSYVLHHADAPAAVIEEVAAACPPGTRLLAIEYHPDAPGAVGPPPERRIAPDRVHGWLVAAGFGGIDVLGFENESYGFRAQIITPAD